MAAGEGDEAFVGCGAMCLPAPQDRLDQGWRILRSGAFDVRMAARAIAWLAAALPLLGGLVLATEMAYQASLGSLAGAPLNWWGWAVDVHAPLPWMSALLLMAGGVAALWCWRRQGTQP